MFFENPERGDTAIEGCGVFHLDGDQKYALDAFRKGRSIALIGGAGSGKTFLLRALIREAMLTHGGYPFVVPCAYSNKVAECINGVTIHSLFAAKPSWEFSREYLLKGVKQNERVCGVLRQMKVLFIDEISLLTSNVMDAIDFVLRELAESEWHSSLPFGGRQVVVSGDPFQLEAYPEVGCLQMEALQAAYESRCWYLTFGPLGDGVVVILKSNHRQRDDNTFFDILCSIRVGKHKESDITFLNGLSRGESNPPNTHTRLCLTNSQTTAINEKHLKLLPGESFKSLAVDKYYFGDKRSMEHRLKKVAPTEVVLKVGARVILTRKIGDIMPGTHALVRRVTDPGISSEYGSHRLELEIETCSASDSREEDKRVRCSGKFLSIRPMRYDVHGYDRTVMASREQVPLLPAYAITIHRAQGMTLTHVAVNFEVAKDWKPNGMVYVALSRCKSSSGLWVSSLRDDLISVSLKAKRFMTNLWRFYIHIPSRISGVENADSLCLTEGEVQTKIGTFRYARAVPKLRNGIHRREERQVDETESLTSLSPQGSSPTFALGDSLFCESSEIEEVSCSAASFQYTPVNGFARRKKLTSPNAKRRRVFAAISVNNPRSARGKSS